MRTWADLPEAWAVWNDEAGGRAVLVYRPDVFDGQDFGPQCLPTLYLTHGPPDRRRPPGEGPGDRWNVTLYLEPEVAFDERPAFSTRDEAVDAAVDMAARFDDGDLDPRAAYQVPREDYLAELDDLLG
jgi:hypothetical protein